MKRLLVTPMLFFTACTFTISTATPPKHKAVRHGGHKYHVAKYVPPPTPPPLPEPETTPELKAKIHESYKPIYEKIPNSFDPPPT